MDSIITPFRKHLTDIHEWHKMGEAKIYPPDSHLELIEGEIIEMPPIGFKHAGYLNRLVKLLVKIVPDEIVTSARNPLQLGDLSEPQPDFMLLKPNSDSYSSRLPISEDVLLLIEIADSSLNFDQTQKLRLYALHNIPEYWLLNLNDNCLEVYRKPKGEVFAEKTTLYNGDNITLSQLQELTIKVSDIL
ncbi:MAG: Uma2 family endonuclease [Gammaproteobacteria bacterium]|nr:Uma2 family endonuclease [Gammaproteobacteria bacterium]